MEENMVNLTNAAAPSPYGQQQTHEILNRVTTSTLITFNLEDYYTVGERVLFDLKDNLHQQLVLREKDLREFIKNHDWAAYTHKFVAITCTVEAIIPTWAYMLISTALQPYAASIVNGSLTDLETMLFHQSLSNIDWQKYKDAKVVIKGCSKIDVPLSAYIQATNQLRSIASSIMYGEPCSTVPIYKAKRG